MAIDHERIRTNGWRQGSVFSLDDTTALAKEVDAASRLIVVSHDCDIVHAGDHEPHVELCLAEHLQDGPNGNYRWARHPRRLDLEIEIAGAQAGYCLYASKRRILDRSILEIYQPDASASLSETELTRVTVWLAKRYNRVALPDAFNARLQGAHERIRRILRNHGTSLSSLLISLKPNDEQEDGESYEVHLLGLMRRADHENADLRAQIERSVNQISDAMEHCPGINVVDTDILSEAEFTLDDLQYFVELSFDDLSLRADPPDPRLPQI